MFRAYINIFDIHDKKSSFKKPSQRVCGTALKIGREQIFVA